MRKCESQPTVVQQIIKRAEESMTDVPAAGREDGYRLYHGRRVARLACRLSRRENLCPRVDCMVLAAACLFHDLGKCQGHDAADHGKTGSMAVEHELRGLVNPRQLRGVRQAIYWHNKREKSPPDLCTEGKLLQDADLLDHFGAQEVWVTIYSAAAERQPVSSALSMWKSEKIRSWTDYALVNLNFPTSRRAMQKRLQFTRRFFWQLQREEKGYLY